MASNNPDSVANQGQFHARVPGTNQSDIKWTKPGNERGNDAAPTFHAETHTPGTAPPESSYRANPIHEVPGQADNPVMESSTRTDALGSIPGTTDRDLYNQTDNLHGRPMEGQEGRELYGQHGEQGKRKKDRSGLEGRGATFSDETVEGKTHRVRADRE
ncbi:hypothetical protein VTK73DRAFT_6670 [Phialemonium thermophilum]|uniref:Uncharacterized protein n=1 Tax=Phialemonium thermophilum TaxID=223376 RepID=A0ABR3WJ59_9PEZI